MNEACQDLQSTRWDMAAPGRSAPAAVQHSAAGWGPPAWSALPHCSPAQPRTCSLFSVRPVVTKTGQAGGCLQLAFFSSVAAAFLQAQRHLKQHANLEAHFCARQRADNSRQPVAATQLDDPHPCHAACAWCASGYRRRGAFQEKSRQVNGALPQLQAPCTHAIMLERRINRCW